MFKRSGCIYSLDTYNFNSLIDSYESLNVALPQSVDPLSLQLPATPQTQTDKNYRFVNQIQPNNIPRRSVFFGSSKFWTIVIILIVLIVLVTVFIVIVGMLLALSKFNTMNSTTAVGIKTTTSPKPFQCYQSTYSVIFNESSVVTCDPSASFSSNNNNNNHLGSCSMLITIEKSLKFSYLTGGCNRNGLIYDEISVTSEQVLMLKHCNGDLCNDGPLMIKSFNTTYNHNDNSSSTIVYPLPDAKANVEKCYTCKDCLLPLEMNSTELVIQNCSQSSLCQVIANLFAL